MEAYQTILEHCWVCKGPFPETKGRHRRITCSNKCRQARYRRLRGQMGWRWKREKKELEAFRARPFVEHRFNVHNFQPIFELSYKRHAYECLACGEVYVVDRTKSGAPPRKYCSPACEEKTERHWKKFNAALKLPHVKGKLDKRVLARMRYNKLSPLCPTCGKPFAPNTTLEGKPLGGRPRKYCSDACRKEAYEQRWKTRHRGRARGHRYRDCPNCSRRFDRTDGQGRRVKRFCRLKCGNAFLMRARRAKQKAKEMRERSVKMVSVKHGAASEKSSQRRVTKASCNIAEGQSSGKTGEGVCSGTKQALKGDANRSKKPTSISTCPSDQSIENEHEFRAIK